MWKKNNLLKYMKMIGKKITSNGMPIYIEISGRCNAKCPYCARQRFKQRYAGKNMSPLLFEKILSHLITIGILNREKNQTICLYNWGEPSLNPEINEILKILKMKNLNAEVSSNFITKPQIDNDNLNIISSVIFSLSGFTQDSYGKIHGASLNKVLNNFEDFYFKLRTYSPDTRIKIAWHRYTFNEKEFWEAYQYFNRPGILFQPTVAYFNDLPEMLCYMEGGLSEDRQKQAENDLFLNHVSQKLTGYQKQDRQNQCFMWNYLVIDETGQLLLCCGMTNHDVDHVLGNVLEMSSKDIMQKKLSDPICKKCIASGFPQSIASLGNMPLPQGRWAESYKLWCQINLYSGLATMLKKMRF